VFYFAQEHYLARVAVDDVDVLLAEWPLQINLLHVLTLDSKVHGRVIVINNHHGKFLHVAQNLLADSLAGAVDADLNDLAS